MLYSMRQLRIVLVLMKFLLYVCICYVAHYVWPYHETVRMSVCLSVTCHISKTEPDRAIVTMDHYIEVGCN